MERKVNERLRHMFDELASAIADKNVHYDRLTLHLPNLAAPLEYVLANPSAPVETVIAPLFSRKELVGRLHATRSGQPFSDDERECIRTMGRLIAACCVGMSEAAVTEERLGEAEVLLEVARATASILDPLELCERAADMIARILPEGAQFAIYARDEERKALRAVAWRTDPSADEALRRLEMPLSALPPLTDEAFKTARIAYTGDVIEEPDDVARIVRLLGLRTLVAVPIRSASENLGVLVVGHPRPNHEMAASTRRLLEAITDQLAVSLRGATLAHENAVRLEELRAISRRLWSVQEEERRRIARELHDEAGQAMTALKLNLDLARREDDAAKVKARIADAVALAGNVLEELRRIARDLRPASLDDLGLVPALRALVDGFGTRTSLDAKFSQDGSTMPTPDSDAAATVFRFVQEALTNVARHAQASTVSVRLRSAGERLVVEVEDDGVGIDGPTSSDGRLGLVGMRERARLLGGRVVLESRSERSERGVDGEGGRRPTERSGRAKGTRLILEIPSAQSELRRGDRP